MNKNTIYQLFGVFAICTVVSGIAHFSTRQMAESPPKGQMIKDKPMDSTVTLSGQMIVHGDDSDIVYGPMPELTDSMRIVSHSVVYHGYNRDKVYLKIVLINLSHRVIDAVQLSTVCANTFGDTIGVDREITQDPIHSHATNLCVWILHNDCTTIAIPQLRRIHFANGEILTQGDEWRQVKKIRCTHYQTH